MTVQVFIGKRADLLEGDKYSSVSEGAPEFEVLPGGKYSRLDGRGDGGTIDVSFKHDVKIWRTKPDDKVTVAQIREFVAELCIPNNGEVCKTNVKKVLDFIDNGPKKPTAEEIAEGVYAQVKRRGNESVPVAIVEELRAQGRLKEDS